MSENNNFNNSSTQSEHSDIRYTYNPYSSGSSGSNAYNTNMSGTSPKKKKFSSNTFFVILIAILLCITVGATGISIYSLISNNQDDFGGSIYATPTPNVTLTPTPTNSGGTNAFESVVQVLPTPTPQIIVGEPLTPQQAAQKVIPSVVCIQSYVVSNNLGVSSSTTPFSEGSGIISRSDGYIITNAHVIDGASYVQVVLHDGTICDADIVGYDTITDLALLKMDPKNLTLSVASFSSSKSVTVADTVLAVGNPGGLDFSSSVTQGIVSALDRAIQDPTTGYVMHCIQTDTAINPGNSGGPLIDLYGNVIGITSSKIVAEGYENMGFAITYDEAAPIINDLLIYGHVKNRATINISLALPSSVFRLSSWSSIPRGLCVTAVTGENEKNSGLKQYDIITSIDGKQITSMADYSSYLLSKKPGDRITLSVYRATISGWSVQYSSTPENIILTLSEAT